VLGGFAFTALMFAHFAAVIAVDGEGRGHEDETWSATNGDYRAGLIRNTRN